MSGLNRLTGLGFNMVPPPAPTKELKDDDFVCGQADTEIIWLNAAEDELICSANGHAFSVTAHPNIIRLLERLNAGVASSVRGLIQEYAGSVVVDDIEFTASPEEIRFLLEKLYSLRAINDNL